MCWQKEQVCNCSLTVLCRPRCFILHDFAVLNAPEILRLSLWFPNMSRIFDFVAEIGVKCGVISKWKSRSGEGNEWLICTYCCFFFSCGSPSLRQATPSASSSASGLQQVPERRVLPLSCASISGSTSCCTFYLRQNKSSCSLSQQWEWVLPRPTRPRYQSVVEVLVLTRQNNLLWLFESSDISLNSSGNRILQLGLNKSLNRTLRTWPEFLLVSCHWPLFSVQLCGKIIFF